MTSSVSELISRGRHNWQVFILVYAAMLALQSAQYHYFLSVITSIEKQFDLSSAKMGLLFGAYDVGRLPLLLLIPYIGRHWHIPRMIGLGYSGTGIALLVMAASRLLTNVRDDRFHAYNSTEAPAQQFCPSGRDLGDQVTTSTSNNVAFTMLYMSIAFIAIFRVPSVTFGYAYHNDNVPKRLLPFAFAISWSITRVGDLAGSYLATWCNSMHVTLSHTDLTPRHPAWVGAWWLGFVIMGGIIVTLSPILMCFPRQLNRIDHDVDGLTTDREPLMRESCVDDSREKDEDKSDLDETEALARHNHHGDALQYHAEDEQIGFREKFIASVKEWMLMFVHLAKNRLFVFFVVCRVTHSLAMSGIGTFQLKYFENQYQLAAYEVSLISGTGHSIVAILSLLIGGYVVSRLNLSFPHMALMCATCIAIAALVFLPSAFISCDHGPVDGLNATHLSANMFENACNSRCNCSQRTFTPVCDNGLTYFSACYAGCASSMTSSDTRVSHDHNTTMYSSCSCTSSRSALEGLCPTDCPRWLPFFTVSFLPTFFQSLSSSASSVIGIRSVETVEQATAMGVMRVFGSLSRVVSSPLTGAIIDTTCLAWGIRADGSRDNCWIYDTTAYRYKLITISATFISLTSLGFFAIYWFSRRKIRT